MKSERNLSAVFFSHWRSLSHFFSDVSYCKNHTFFFSLIRIKIQKKCLRELFIRVENVYGDSPGEGSFD